MHSTTPQPTPQKPQQPPTEWGPMWWLAWYNGGANGAPQPQAEPQQPNPQPEPPEPMPQPKAPEPTAPAPAEAEPVPCPQPLQPDDLIPPEALDEARAYLALGDRKEFNRRMEALFVAGLTTLLECEGDQGISQVMADFAYLMDLSTETIKRYLKKHASRWGPFEMVGDVVKLRRRESHVGRG